MRPSPLILIEFNELCPSLIEQFANEGHLPNFRTFFRDSSCFITDAGESEPNLEPWIQWPTVHSGMTYGEHGVFHLGDGRGLDKPCLARLLSDAGVRVGVFGSMNTNYRTLNGYVVPDPWDRHGEAHPAAIAPFYNYVADQVRESSRPSAGSWRDSIAFATFLLRNGLTAGTGWALAKQILAERRDPGVRWKRAMLLDRVQYDVFRSLNRRHAVQFATFFCNSTAHFQHYHWRNMAPEAFTVPPPASDHPSLRDAILDGYKAMDTLLGRFLADYPAHVLVLATALSQQAWTTTTKCTFRPKRFEDLLKFANVSTGGATVKPVMAEQFHVECASPEVADAAASGFEQLLVGGEPLMDVQRSGTTVFAGCRFTDTAVLERTVVRKSDGAARPFKDLFYMIHTMRSGRHHPDGVLWVRNGRHRVEEDKVPLVDVAPTILAHFGVDQPEHMNGRPLLV